MIKAEKGSVHIMGTEAEVLNDFGTIVASMANQFGQNRVIEFTAAAIVLLEGKAQKIDLSDLGDVLDKLKKELGGEQEF